MSERNSETHDNKSRPDTSVAGPGTPGPPPPPPPTPASILNLSPLSITEKTPLAESHESVVYKLVQKLIEWGTLGGPAGCAISRQVPHIPQIGPKCGIVALNMALSVFIQEPVTVSELLDIARERKYTNHGEMFCAENLKQLALTFLPNGDVEIINSELFRQKEYVAEVIASGNLLLVPYDSSRNFSPECLQGHKAHWAIITGIIIPSNDLFADLETPQLKVLEPGEEALRELKKHLPAASCLHVLALQGKSRHLSAWPLEVLVRSNENLKQLDPEREASELEYIVPEGGLHKGLCGKAILLKHP